MKYVLNVRLRTFPDRSYPINIMPGILKKLPGVIAKEYKGKSVFVITDSTVHSIYGKRFLRDLMRENVQASLLEIPPGEKSKSSDTVADLYTRLLSRRIQRDSLIVALGGGVVGDIAGFVAATILRGIQYIQIPTTLLAQIDSSVGGKVGIDHPLGKNLIGAFHQPAAVYIDSGLLRTLPSVEFQSGLVEMVKIAAALDKRFFERIERSIPRITKDNSTLLSNLTAEAVGLKAAVVMKDEFEVGIRKALNLGHTIGHAIEASSGYEIKHGPAVAMGIAAEAIIALNMRLLNQQDYSRLIKVMRKLRLPVDYHFARGNRRFFEALSLDKKSEGGRNKFVLLRRIGTSVIGVDVPPALISELD